MESQDISQLSDPDDGLAPTTRAVAAVFKFVVPVTRQGDWDAGVHRAGEIDRALQHDPAAGTFDYRPDDYEPASGGEPPVHDGEWKLENVWVSQFDKNRNWTEFQQEQTIHKDEATTMARSLVQKDQTVHAALVYLVEDGGRRWHVSDAKIPVMFVATGRRSKSARTITTVKPKRGWQKAFSDAQLRTVMSKVAATSGLKGRQIHGLLNFNKDVGRQAFTRQLWPQHIRGYQHTLALTPDGWRVVADPHTGLPRRQIQGDNPSNNPLWHYSKGKPGGMQYDHMVMVHVEWDDKHWRPSDLHFIVYPHTGHPYINTHTIGAWHVQRLRKGEEQQRRMNDEPGWRPYHSDMIRADEIEYMRDSVNTSEERLNHTLDRIPWMTPGLRAVANPFRLPPEEWDRIAEEAILRSHDDEQYQKEPTFADPKEPE